MRITVEGDDVSIMPIQSRTECLPELKAGYILKDLWNIHRNGVFFKALPEKGLIQKAKGFKSSKKSKQ